MILDLAGPPGLHSSSVTASFSLVSVFPSLYLMSSNGPAWCRWWRCSRGLVSAMRAVCYLRIDIHGLWSPCWLREFSAGKWTVSAAWCQEKFTGSLAGQHKVLQGHLLGKENIDLLSLPPPSLPIHPSVHSSTVWGPHFGHISSKKVRKQVMQYDELGRKMGRAVGRGQTVPGADLSPHPLTSLEARLSEPVFSAQGTKLNLPSSLLWGLVILTQDLFWAPGWGFTSWWDLIWINQDVKDDISCKDGLNNGQKWYIPNRSRKY